MIGNVNQPSTNQIMDVDGTLKTGAVDVAAVLANNVVETAAIADDAVTLAKLQNITRGSILVGGTADAPTLLDANDSGKILVGDGTDLKSVAVSGQATLSAAGALTLASGLAQLPNLVWDPFNEFIPVAAFHLSRKQRWQYTANLTILTDAANPFGKPTLRLAAAGNAIGKKIYLADMAVATGQPFTVAWTGMGLTDTVKLYAYWRNAGGTVLSAQESATTATTGAAQTITVTGTIPATAAYVEIFVLKTGTAAALDTYHMGLWIGSYAGSLASHTPSEIVAMIAADYVDRNVGINVVPDPFNRTTGPGAPHGTTWRGRLRFNNVTNLSIVTGDANNPYGGNTLRIASATTIGGRIIYADEAGLKPGDWFSAGVVCNVASGTLRLNIAFYTVASAYITNVESTSVTATGAWQAIDTIGQIPATAYRIDINLYRVSGSGDMDIYATMFSRGRMPVPIAPDVDNSQFWAEIEDARGAYATLSARLAAPQFTDELDHYGPHFLRSWQAQIAKIKRSESGSQARISVVGDSWCFGIAQKLQALLEESYGDAGPGFQQFTSEAEYGFNNAWWTKTGTWTEDDQTATSKGPGARHVSSADTATPAGFQLIATCQEMEIHYVKQAGGGSFRYRVDGGGWTTVATDAASAYATEAITGLTNTNHTLDIEVTVAGTGVILTGVDCRLTGIGCIVDWLGNGGAAALSFSQLDETLWRDAMAAIAPDVVILLLGTNDHSNNVAPATFSTRMATVINRLQAELPLTDILLLSPADNGLAGKTYTVSQYVGELRNLAVAEACAMMDAYLNVGAYADGNARGLYANTSHLDDTGYYLVARAMIERLLK